MNTYIVLLRGINVGGKNKVPMAELKNCLEELGFAQVSTYIASGNVILQSEAEADEVKKVIEQILPQRFRLDSDLVKVLVLTVDQLKSVVDDRPKGFGDKPDVFHSDVLFLIDIQVDEALKVFDPREGVDMIWPGDKAIYSQRLSAERTKSRLNKVIGTRAYQSMTGRNWNTVTKLLGLAQSYE